MPTEPAIANVWIWAAGAYNPTKALAVFDLGAGMQSSGETPRVRPAHKAAVPVFVGAAVILAALAYMREGDAPTGGDDGVPQLAKVPGGAAAPGFRATSLSGQTISLPDGYRGKVVLVDFWATWCGPCVREFPALLAAYEKYHERGFEIIGVSLDESKGITASRVQSFLGQRKVPWEVIYDGADSIAGAYRVMTIPTAYLVDGDTGRVVAGGWLTRGEALAATIEQALKNKSDG